MRRSRMRLERSGRLPPSRLRRRSSKENARLRLLNGTGQVRWRLLKWASLALTFGPPIVPLGVFVWLVASSLYSFGRFHTSTLGILNAAILLLLLAIIAAWRPLVGGPVVVIFSVVALVASRGADVGDELFWLAATFAVGGVLRFLWGWHSKVRGG